MGRASPLYIRKPHHARWCGLALVCLSWFAVLRVNAADTQVPEYSVKAAYILLFARYVYWPDGAFASADTPLTIAILGEDPFGTLLDETMRDQKIDTHPIRVLRVNDPDNALDAHVVFVSQSMRKFEKRWLDKYSGRATLTIGESTESLEAGAIVKLVEDRSKIRFDIDVGAAEASRLRIASPMLVSARRLRGYSPKTREGG